MKLLKTLVFFGFVVATAVAAAAPAAAWGKAERKEADLAGSVLPRPIPAPDFSLTDQNSAPFRMASTKGKVVVLSYIYTHCTDVCPFITVKLKDAFALLGQDAAKTVFVTVTTDPKRDTPPVLAAYSRAVGMYDKWRFVTGPLATMRKVWADYGVGVDIERGTDSEKAGQDATDSHQTHDATEEASSAPQSDLGAGLSKIDRSLVGRIIEEFGGGYEVGHSTPFWFVDPSGFIRVTLGADASPADIARNVHALMTAK